MNMAWESDALEAEFSIPAFFYQTKHSFKNLFAFKS